MAIPVRLRSRVRNLLLVETGKLHRLNSQHHAQPYVAGRDEVLHNPSWQHGFSATIALSMSELRGPPPQPRPHYGIAPTAGGAGLGALGAPDWAREAALDLTSTTRLFDVAAPPNHLAPVGGGTNGLSSV